MPESLFEMPVETPPAVEVRTIHLVVTCGPDSGALVAEVSVRGPQHELISWRSFWPSQGLEGGSPPLPDVLRFAEEVMGR